MNVVEVGVQGPTSVLNHGAYLTGLSQGRLGGRQHVPVRHVEYSTHRNHAALGKLGIRRPVVPHLVPEGKIRQPVVVIDAVDSEIDAADANRSLSDRIGGGHPAEATHGLAVVLILIQMPVVVGGFYAW